MKTAMLSLQALMCSPEPNDPQVGLHSIEKEACFYAQWLKTSVRLLLLLMVVVATTGRGGGDDVQGEAGGVREHCQVRVGVLYCESALRLVFFAPHVCLF
jgi:hypothetical protein